MRGLRFKLLIFSLYLVPFALYLSFIWYARPDSNGRPADSKSEPSSFTPSLISLAIGVIAQNSISRNKVIPQLLPNFLKKSHTDSHTEYFLSNASNTIKTESVSPYDPEALWIYCQSRAWTNTLRSIINQPIICGISS